MGARVGVRHPKASKGSWDWSGAASRGAIRIYYCHCSCRRAPTDPQEKEEDQIACSKRPVAKEPASEPVGAAPVRPGLREGFSLPRSSPSVPSRSARLVSAERAKSQESKASSSCPVPAEKAKGKSVEAAAPRPASTEKAKGKSSETASSRPVSSEKAKSWLDRRDGPFPLEGLLQRHR